MARLLLFAAAREAAGCREAEVEAGTVGEALQAAAARFGRAFEGLLGCCAVLVGDTPVAPDRRWETPVGPGTEVAVLPPVSGGEHGERTDGHAPTAAGALAPPVRVAVLTVSDRSALGVRADQAGPAVEHVALEAGWDVVARAVVADEAEQVEEALRAWSDQADVDLVLTTGGTGLGPRDVTPEATRAVVDREVPGVPEAMRRAGMAVTPYAALARQVAGQRGATLIVNLPGSPTAATQCLRSVLVLLPHAVEMGREAGRGG